MAVLGPQEPTVARLQRPFAPIDDLPARATFDPKDLGKIVIMFGPAVARVVGMANHLDQIAARGFIMPQKMRVTGLPWGHGGNAIWFRGDAIADGPTMPT